MVLMSGTQSSALSTSMDTIWDLNINSSGITSPSIPSAPRQHWQLHKGINEIAISSQFPSALPQRLLKRGLTFLWLSAVCVEREAIQGQMPKLKSAYNIKNMLRVVHTEIIYIHVFDQQTQVCHRDVFLLYFIPYGHQFSLPTIALLPSPSFSEAKVLCCLWLMPWTDPHVCPVYQTSRGLMVSPEQGSDKAAACSTGNRG